MTEPAMDDEARRRAEGYARVAAASEADLVEEARANGFSPAAYKSVVAALARASTPPGVEFTMHEPTRGRREGQDDLDECEDFQDWEDYKAQHGLFLAPRTPSNPRLGDEGQAARRGACQGP